MIGSFHSRYGAVPGVNNAKLMVWTFNNAHDDWASARKHHSHSHSHDQHWSPRLRQSFSSIFKIIAIYFFFFSVISSFLRTSTSIQSVSRWMQCVQNAMCSRLMTMCRAFKLITRSPRLYYTSVCVYKKIVVSANKLNANAIKEQ